MIIKSYKNSYEVKFEDKIDISSHINKNTFFVIDKNVYNLYEKHFSEIDKKQLFLIDATEQNKTLETVVGICEKFTEISAKKNAVIVSLGGGITQDISGFAANILYRGIRWIFYPTTLLAACDSCVGSKTSLNFKKYKNLLGTFYPPSEIIIVPSFFKTLSRYDLASGLGEVVKFNIMSGEESLGKLEKDISGLIELNEEKIKEYVANSLKFKSSFVENDEFDVNERVLLNFAHTFGHAIETASGYEIPHGTAVAIGVLVANRISVERKILSEKAYERIERLIKKIIIMDIGNIDLQVVIESIKNDKKQISDKIRAILLNGDYKLSLEYLTEKEISDAYKFVWDKLKR